MAMVVRSNLMAYNANRQLGMNNSAVSKNLEKLSSGFKINRAADDAAGLAISEKMKAQIKGLETASSNSQDGISLVQTAEGALTEVHDMLNRMTELATKSANGTIKNEVDREAIQNEVNKLNEEIDRISQSTNFNGINLLDGSLSTSGASKSGAASEVNFEMKGLQTSSVEAVKAKFTAAAIAVSSKTGDGETFTFNVSTEDGKNHSVTLTYDKENLVFIGNNGKEYGAAPTGISDKVSISVVAQAMAEALADTELGNTYNITQDAATGRLTFEAKVAGAIDNRITGFSQESKTSTGAIQVTLAAVGISELQTGADAFATISTIANNFKVFDGTNAKDSVFTVNGKKFALVGNDTDENTIKKLADDVTVIRGVDSTSLAAGADNADAAIIIAAINRETGLNLSLDSTGDGIKLVDAGSTGSKASGGLTLQIGDTGEDFNQVTVSVDNMSSKGIGTKDLDVSNQKSAKAAIETIKSAINKVSTNRSEMGALQNRLEHTINNLDVAAENMTNANSRIRDTDMAKQMMEYTKMNVLTQSAQAMLAQANQNPQSILQLLQ